MEGYGSIPNNTKRQKITKISELPDYYSPSFDSSDRVSTVSIGVFNVLNTCVGGGTLSLPFAFSKCGWLVGTLIIFFSMICTSFSMNLLCTLSRKLGCATYSDVMEKSLGYFGKRITTLLLFSMLFLVIIAFLVLLKDISSDIIQFFLADSYILTDRMKNLITIFLTFLFFPLMTADHLHSLRYVSYAGTGCVLLLLFSITYEAFTAYKIGELTGETIRWGPTNSSDVFIGLPIIFISFLCQFNIIGVYSDLESPTEKKMNTVINISMTIAAIIFVLFGLVGYFFASDHTQDNILKNFSPHNPSLFIARIGLTVTLLCQLPMVVLPCRKAFYPLMWPKLNTADNHSQHIDGQLVELPHPSSFYGEDTTLLNNSSNNQNNINSYSPRSPYYNNNFNNNNNNNIKNVNSNGNNISNTTNTNTTANNNNNNNNNNNFSRERCYSNSGIESNVAVYVPVDEGYDIVVNQSSSRYIITFGLVVISLFFSEAVPGVSTVWSIAGSTLSIIIAFLLPAFAYISIWNQLGSSKVMDISIIGAYGLLILSILLIILCTFQTLVKIFNP